MKKIKKLCRDLISIKNSNKLKILFSLGRSNLGLVFFSNDYQLIEKLKKISQNKNNLPSEFKQRNIIHRYE